MSLVLNYWFSSPIKLGVFVFKNRSICNLSFITFLYSLSHHHPSTYLTPHIIGEYAHCLCMCWAILAHNSGAVPAVVGTKETPKNSLKLTHWGRDLIISFIFRRIHLLAYSSSMAMSAWFDFGIKTEWNNIRRIHNGGYFAVAKIPDMYSLQS